MNDDAINALNEPERRTGLSFKAASREREKDDPFVEMPSRRSLRPFVRGRDEGGVGDSGNICNGSYYFERGRVGGVDGCGGRGLNEYVIFREEGGREGCGGV